MSDKIDISPEAVERLAERADVYQFEMDGRTVNAGKTLRALSARLAEVEKERDDARGNSVSDFMKLLDARRRAEAAEAALATARRDACGRAAMVAEAWIARKENLISLPDAIRALANEAPE